MKNTETEILDAALRMFSRFGVKRTSMGDLASQAGVSRQTLYNAFRNKDDVLRALIRTMTDDALNRTETALQGVQGLGQQLDILFQHMAVAGFDFVRDTPNAQDIIDGFNAAGQTEIAASAERFRQVTERLLAPHQQALAAAGLRVPDLSDFVQRAAKAASSTARDRDHLLSQLATLRHLCQAAAGNPEPNREKA